MVGIAFFPAAWYTDAAGGVPARAEKKKTVGCPASEKEALPHEQKEKRIRRGAGAAECQLGAVPALMKKVDEKLRREKEKRTRK